MVKRKVISVLLMVSMLGISVSGCGQIKGSSDSESKDVIELKISSSGSDTSTWQEGALKFAELIEKYTDGRYTGTVYASDQLSGGSQSEGIELVQNGSTDVHICDSMIWASACELAAVPTFPWLLSNYEEVDEAMEGEGGNLLKEALNESGVVCLAVGEAGYRQIVNTKQEIKEPEDLEGMVVRVPGSQIHMALFGYLGADAISMSQSEVYTSLQTGAIDACENTLDLLYSQGTLETVSYLTLWNYSYDPIFLSVSEELWNSLSEEDQEAFQTAADEAMQYEKELARQTADDLIDTIKEEYPNLSVVEELSDDELAEFQESVADLYENYKDSIGKDVFEAFGYTFES